MKNVSLCASLIMTPLLTCAALRLFCRSILRGRGTHRRQLCLGKMVIPEAPQNLVGDNAYDSDKLDAELSHFGIELIARHRSNRKNKSRTDAVCGPVGDDGR